MKPFKAYANVLRLRLNMLLRRTVISNYPVVAYVEPTLYCNLRCPACPTGLRLGLRPAATLKWELFKTFIDEVGDYLFELFMYNWGEPLLHRQTPEMIAYAKARDMFVLLTTNFSLELSDDYLQRLVDSGLDTLIVSMDGATELTYAHYRRGGDFEQVRRNMQRLQAIKKRKASPNPQIGWQFLVFRHNEHEIEYVRQHYRAWGADALIIEGAQMPFAPHDAGFAPPTTLQYNLYHPDHAFQRKPSDRRPCSWLYGTFVLNPNGAVSPCCGTAAEKSDFGHYEPGRGYFALINNEQFQRARRLFKRPSASAPASPMLRGMAADVQTDKDELICHRCPIPFRQDDVHRAIARALHRTWRDSWRNPRCWLALILMGGPNRDGLLWLWKQLKSRLRTLLSRSA